jgi:hypothetical protein
MLPPLQQYDCLLWLTITPDASSAGILQESHDEDEEQRPKKQSLGNYPHKGWQLSAI